MARRRRSKRQDDRDAESPTSLAPAGHQALHRAVVRSTNDRRQFHPQKEIIHALRKQAAVLQLVKIRKTIARNVQRVVSPKRSSIRSRRVHSALQKRPAHRARPRLRSPLQRLFKVAVPRSVAICVRRKERREVLFASGAGGSKKISRVRRRNQHSNIRCK